MEGKLFGKSPEKSVKKKEFGVRSLIFCKEERAKLRHCFRTSSLGWCSKEQIEFWECFNKEKDRLDIEAGRIEGIIPENHWGDNPDTSRDEPDPPSTKNN